MSDWPYVGGEMANLVRAFDWGSTPLGPIESWRPELLATATFILENPFPAALIWGPQLVTIYNDGFRPILGGKPEALGRSFEDIWREAWNEIGPIAARAMSGEPTFISDYPLVIQRNGVPELAFFTFSYSPVRAADGSILGMMDTVVETTETVRAREALAGSEERYRMMFETMDEGYLLADVIFDDDGRAVDIEYVTSNPAAIRMVGTDLTGRRLRDVADYEEYWYEIWGRVAITGNPERLERYAAPNGIWYEFYVFKIEPKNSESRRVAVLFKDGTRRKLAEDALRKSDERQAFLLKLGDALRAQPDPQAVGELAVRMVGEHLAADRCYFCEISAAEDRATVLTDFHSDALQSIVGDHKFSDFPELMRRVGEAIVFDDCQNDPQLSAKDRAAFAALDMGSFLTKTLRKGGQDFHWSLTVTTREPRIWSEDDRQAIEEAAEKVWFAIEQARAEAALKATRERQEFLLRLSDALRPLGDPFELKRTAVQVLGHHLGACRVAYAENDEENASFIVSPNYVDGVPNIVGRYPYGDYGVDIMVELEAGKTRILPDVANDPLLSDFQKSGLAAAGIGASLNVPLLKNGKLIAFLSVHYPVAHEFRPQEIELVAEVADRTWAAVERAKAEEALRQSEEKYRTIFDSIDEGFCVIEVILDEHGKAVDLLHLEANEAYGRYTGLHDIVGKRAREVIPEGGPWLDFYGNVALTGRAARNESYLAGPIGRWIASYASRIGGEGSLKVAVVFNDVTERKLAEQVLREGEERQSFLLKLSDSLRAETDVEAVGNLAVRMIAEYLGLDRVYLVALNPDDDLVVVTHETRRDNMPSMRGSYRGSEFPGAFRQIFERTIFYEDVRTEPSLTELDRQSFVGIGAVGFAAVPMRRGSGTMIWAAGAVSTRPRSWTTNEIVLLEDATERTWAAVERARSETELRDSEERFRQLGEASRSAIWVRDSTTFAFEYVSPSVESLYGITPDALMRDERLLGACVVPEERDAVSQRVRRISEGETLVQEYRIRRASDGAFRWIRSTGFPIFNNDGHVRRIGGIADDVTDTKIAVEHQGVLLAELQHRVRNLMGIIRSMANRSANGPETVEDYRSSLEGRLLALSRVQTLLTRHANRGGSLRGVVENEIAAQAHHHGQYELSGPDVMLSPKIVEVLTLAFHELSTNALKYGGLSVPEGRVIVRWDVSEQRGGHWLSLDWTEEGTPRRDPPTRRGFGSELIEMKIPYELRGKGSLAFEEGRVRCRLEIPLTNSESILETDAPTPITVHGGSLDMTGAPDLQGRSVLVVEDDYYMASDVASVLRSAGGKVLGPCPTEEAALLLLETETPSCAILDLNLGGGGPKFPIALLLRERGIPFIFLTGYDPELIPDDMTDVVRLQKPVGMRDIVDAISKL